MQEIGKYVIIYTDMLEKLTYRQAILFGVLNGMAVKEGYCYARNKTLSKILNCSEDSIQRDLNVLQKLNYIHREIERNDKMEVVSRKIYILTATLHIPLTAGLRIPSPLNCDNNKKNNNNINNIELLFDELWTLYTKKGNRKDSLSAFSKLKKNEIELVKQHLPIYIKNHIDNDKMKFLPHFSTYLNGKRFNDNLPYEEIKKIEVKQPNFLNLDD